MFSRKNSTGSKLTSLDVTQNNVRPNKVNGARLAMETSGATERQQLDFMSCCLKLLSATVVKIQERSPLKYSFLCSLSQSYGVESRISKRLIPNNKQEAGFWQNERTCLVTPVWSSENTRISWRTMTLIFRG